MRDIIKNKIYSATGNIFRIFFRTTDILIFPIFDLKQLQTLKLQMKEKERQRERERQTDQKEKEKQTIRRKDKENEKRIRGRRTNKEKGCLTLSIHIPLSPNI